MKAVYFASLLLALCSGCASLQSVSVTNIPRERGRPVEATANNPAFLGLHFSNGFADDLPDELRAQCPDGKVTGIYSKYESTWYVLVQDRSVTVKGYCVTPDKRALAPSAPPSVPLAPQPPALPPSLPAAPSSPATPAGAAEDTTGATSSAERQR